MMINTISIKKGCSITTDIVECDYNNGKEILLKEAKSLYSDAFYYKNKIYFKRQVGFAHIAFLPISFYLMKRFATIHLRSILNYRYLITI